MPKVKRARKSARKRLGKRKPRMFTLEELYRVHQSIDTPRFDPWSIANPPPGQIWSYRQKKFVTMSQWWNDG